MNNSDNTYQPPAPKKSRKRGFIVPADFFSDIHTQLFLSTYGFEPIGYLMHIYSILMEAPGKTLYHYDMKHLQVRLNLDEADLDKLINLLVEHDFIQRKSGEIWSWLVCDELR